MRKIATLLALVMLWLLMPTTVFAAETNTGVSEFVKNSLNSITLIAGSAAAFFVAKGGYQYITSSGSPDAISSAKKTIRNAFFGLVLVIAASTFASLLFGIRGTSEAQNNIAELPVIKEQVEFEEITIGYVLKEAIFGFLKSLVESIGEPISKFVTDFLRSTPSLLENKVIFNFWLIVLGISDALLALVIALIGLQVMSADTFGFEEIELKKIFPKIGLAFLGANSSIFLIDWIIRLNDTLVSAVYFQAGTKSLNDVFTATMLSSLSAFTSILFVVFLIFAIGVLIMYINRLIILAVGAVLSPLIFLLWLMPRFSSFVDNAIKMYFSAIFLTFIHAIILVLGVSFLSFDDMGNTNPIVSILMGIGLMGLLLKTPSTMMSLWMANSAVNTLTNAKGQIINVISSTRALGYTAGRSAAGRAAHVVRKGLAKI